MATRTRRPMTASQRRAVGVRMKQYWASRRKANGRVPKERAVATSLLTGDKKDELAKLGARVRLTELQGEVESLQRFLKHG